MAEYPFRLGTTSYIYSDDLVSNAEQLAYLVDDIELVLFDVEGFSNLPDAATAARLAEIAALHNLTYTVHLPFDLLPSYGREYHPIAEKMRRVIDMTRELNPIGYVVHLDASEPTARDTEAAWEKWRDGCARSLEPLINAAGNPALLCAENLESYPQDTMLKTLERLPVSLCLDIGHLWLKRLDAVNSLRMYLPRTRIIHLHGVNERVRDHASLAHVAVDELQCTFAEIARQDFRGVITLEVFSLRDFETSWDLVKKWTKNLY